MVQYDREESNEEEEDDESRCNLLLDIPNVYLPDQLDQLTATLTTPTGAVAALTPQSGPENTLCISFVPQEAGVHLVDVKYEGEKVEGSPFRVTIDR